MKTDPRVDAYIERQADFARPILERLRAAVHAACPDGEEAIKWGMPAFLHRGQILAHMAGFKAHAAFGFWRGKEVVGDTELQREAMGQFGRLSSVEDMPEEATLAALIAKAMALAGQSGKPPRAQTKKPPATVPDDLRAAIDADPAAAAAFEGFPPGARRDYVDWIVEARREETRAKRIALAVEWLAQGKRRHWKYEKC